MKLALLVMTDGRRDCITQTIASARDNLIGFDDAIRLIHDDSGDRDYGAWLRGSFRDFEVVSTGRRSGFGGAIRSAWSTLFETSDITHVAQIEDDFTFNRLILLPEMAVVLGANPHLAQLALRRQPWNEAERRAGGVVELQPEAFTEREWNGQRWLEHRAFWTTNPCLYRAQLMQAGWPDGAQSEGRFTRQLLDDGLPWGVAGTDVRFGYWGARDSGEWVHHIGHQRVGTGY